MTREMPEKGTRGLKDRNMSYDILRICAAIMVVFLHVAAQKWYSLTPDSVEWGIMNAYDSIVRSAVPIFFMLSGAFLLKKDISLKELYLKKIIPLSMIWIVWSFLYAVDRIGIDRMLSTKLSDIAVNTIESHYHLWFIPTLIGLYVLHPILRGIVSYKNGNGIRYLIMIFFVFGILRQTLAIFAVDPLFSAIIHKVPLELMSYSGYMILGYYIVNVDDHTYNPKILILIFVCSAIVCATVGQVDSMNKGEVRETLYGYFSITTFIESVCLFYLCKNRTWNCSDKIKKVILDFSAATFGIYLIHPFVIDQLDLRLNLNTLTYNPCISVPVNAILTVVISSMVILCGIRTPIIRKLLKF